MAEVVRLHAMLGRCGAECGVVGKEQSVHEASSWVSGKPVCCGGGGGFWRRKKTGTRR